VTRGLATLLSLRVSELEPAVKVLVIHSLSSGGAERVISDLANAWAERGESVAIVTYEDVHQDFYRLHPRIIRKVVPTASQSRNLFAGGLNAMSRVRALRRVLRSLSPTCVCAFTDVVAIETILASRGMSARVVVSHRTNPLVEPLALHWRALRRALFPSADALVLQTEGVRRWFSRFVSARKLHVIPNAVATSVVADLSKLENEEPRPRLMLAVGRLCRQKGFDLLLRAFAVASPRGAWQLAIVGEGPDRSRLTELARELGLEEKVSLPGRSRNIHEWFARADLFVLSSRWEGFPNVLLEAMASGLPCVSFDCDFGPGEIIVDRSMGILVPAEDLTALAKALEHAMANCADYGAMATAARTSVRERFASDRILTRWDEVLQGVS
jgi:GalNAc-alpha-(1->4)-GalNAc-alpha-(1->3)-diNAcBac-PP-undecaprenol alpha-1,4-N-acetyl-D-galactosaminyltransferase